MMIKVKHQNQMMMMMNKFIIVEAVVLFLNLLISKVEKEFHNMAKFGEQFNFKKET